MPHFKQRNPLISTSHFEKLRKDTFAVIHTSTSNSSDKLGWVTAHHQSSSGCRKVNCLCYIYERTLCFLELHVLSEMKEVTWFRQAGVCAALQKVSNKTNALIAQWGREMSSPTQFEGIICPPSRPQQNIIPVIQSDVRLPRNKWRYLFLIYTFMSAGRGRGEWEGTVHVLINSWDAICRRGLRSILTWQHPSVPVINEPSVPSGVNGSEAGSLSCQFKKVRVDSAVSACQSFPCSVRSRWHWLTRLIYSTLFQTLPLFYLLLSCLLSCQLLCLSRSPSPYITLKFQGCFFYLWIYFFFFLPPHHSIRHHCN